MNCNCKKNCHASFRCEKQIKYTKIELMGGELNCIHVCECIYLQKKKKLNLYMEITNEISP